MPIWAVGDLDSDGDLDVFVATSEDRPRTPSLATTNKVWLNDGSGTFSLNSELASTDSSAVALGDLDGDGDPDMFVASDGSDDTVWVQQFFRCLRTPRCREAEEAVVS